MEPTSFFDDAVDLSAAVLAFPAGVSALSAAVVVFGAEAALEEPETALEDAAAVVEGDVVLRVPDADLVAPAAVFVDFVPPVDFVVELERAGFPLDVLPAAVFDDEPVAPALLDAVVFAAVFVVVFGEVLAVDDFAVFAVDDFAEAESDDFPSFSVFTADPALGLRRREDCIEAAGSVRAVREVFCSPSLLPSSPFPPEKKTSTGRSLEFASGISAPRPRPRPLFLRSATTYSSIRDFFCGLSVRECTARMWII